MDRRRFGDRWRRSSRVLMVVVMAAVTLPVAAPADAAADGTVIVAHAVGATGEERLAFQIDGVTQATVQVTNAGHVWSSATPTTAYTYTHPTDVDPDRIRVAFVNNGLHDGVDMNLRIPVVDVDGRAFATDAADVESRGTWANGSRCGVGFYRSPVLACDGWFQLPAGQPAGGDEPDEPDDDLPEDDPVKNEQPAGDEQPSGDDPAPGGDDGEDGDVTEIVVVARGATGEERLELQIDGETEATWIAGPATTEYPFTVAGEVGPDDVRVAFTNDAVIGGRDRNVQVDAVVIGGVRYESEHPSVLSKGVWANGARCREGTFNTDLLACNGWFQYTAIGGVEPPDPVGVGPDLDVDVDVLADGLTNPWGLAFLPDGRLLFTERLGRLRLLQPDGTVDRIEIDLPALGSGTSGLLGLAVDPDFATNRRIYTCQGRVGPDRQEITAWRLDDGLTVATAVTTLVSVDRNGGHSGCALLFDDDGWLLATFGDDYVGTNPQDPYSVHGKVLRLDPVTGEGHPDNPFADGGGDERILTLGHRNPQGIVLHPDTRQPWTVEHGPSFDDEINRLVAGGNYGWDPAGPIDSTGTNPYVELTTPMTDPAIDGSIEAWWASGSPTVAPGGLAFLSGDHWGDHEGALIMSTLKNTRLHVFTPGADGDGALAAEADVPALHDSYGRLRQVVLGPDGALYVATSNSGFGDADLRLDRLLRLTPPGYQPPVSPDDDQSEGPNDDPTDDPTDEPVDEGDGDDPIDDGVGSELVVRAIGHTGTEELAIEVDGVEVDRFVLAPTQASFWGGDDWRNHTYRHPTPLTAGQVRLVFDNNGITSTGGDRNVRVDHIRIDGHVFETEDPAVVSKGSWGRGSRCGVGSFGNDNLACDGYIQYHGGEPVRASSPTIAVTRVATLGDSNTASGYWRWPFQQELVAADCTVDLVGRTRSGWGDLLDLPAFDADTDASSGATLASFRNPDNAVFVHGAATLATDPDLVIVTGGTNDLLGLDVDDPDDLALIEDVVTAVGDQLVDAAAAAPSARFVVVAIPPIRGHEDEVATFNRLLAAEVVGLSASLPVRHVAVDVPDGDLGADGVHLTVEGGDRLGRAIAAAVGDELGELRAC